MSCSQRRATSFSIVIFLVGVMNVSAQWRLEPVLDSIAVRGIDCIWKQEYTRADSLFCDMIHHRPDHPAGYFFKVAVMQAYTIDFDLPIEREKYDSLLDCGRKAAEHMLSPWREYYLGTADGYEAFECVVHGDWFGGVRKGISSASEFEDAVEKDSSFFDAYIGIGTYYYWSSRKTAFLRWLPFVKDNRELGVKLLVAGAEYSEYNRFAAISALISIFLDSENYLQTEEWSRRGLKFYPENRVFLWGLATALDRQKRYPDAVSAYENLLENIVYTSSPHPYGEIVCRLNLVKSKLALHDTTMAVYHLKKICSYEKISFPNMLRSRAEEKFEETRILLSALENQRTRVK